MKPRIIIADTDIGYIIPLQLRFIEEFFDKIDLEIITDRNYFNSVFATPQKADILIVSEDLYESGLQRHSLGNIFLMMEQFEEESTNELNVNRIYKYTSIKEIFNEILGKSSNTFKISLNTKQEPQIIMVYSAAGGVGKTTIAMGIAACLTKNYKKVLYINASWLHSFQRVLENKSYISSNEVYSVLMKMPETLYADIKHVLRKELFTYLPPFKASLMSIGLQYSVFEKIACSAKKSGEFDYIIVDADVGFDLDKASLIGIADRVLIITKQTAASVYATNALVESINGVKNEKYTFICNDFEPDKDNALISTVVPPKFAVSEYVEHIQHIDNLKPEELTLSSGINKASVLVI